MCSFVARLAGFEPAALGLEGRCSIQLSYRRNSLKFFYEKPCLAEAKHDKYLA